MSTPLPIIPGRRWHRILTACIRAPLRPNDLCRKVRPARAGWFRQDKSKTHKACQLLRQHGLLMYDSYGEGYLTTEKGKAALGLSELTVADDIPVPKVQVFGLREQLHGQQNATDRAILASQTGGQEDEVLPATRKSGVRGPNQNAAELGTAKRFDCTHLRCTTPNKCRISNSCQGGCQ